MELFLVLVAVIIALLPSSIAQENDLVEESLINLRNEWGARYSALLTANISAIEDTPCARFLLGSLPGCAAIEMQEDGNLAFLTSVEDGVSYLGNLVGIICINFT